MNATKFHETAMHHAAREERGDLVELLVEFGGDVNITDNMGNKPRDYTKLASPAYGCLLHYESMFDFLQFEMKYDYWHLIDDHMFDSI